MRKIVFLLFFISLTFCSALEFKVASYNVENFFDLKYDKTEYKEYIPHTKYWHKKSFYKKLHNISKVINDIDAHIIALQEIESKEVIKYLLTQTNYKYHSFLKKQTSSVGVAILSKFPIIKNEEVVVNRYNKHSRPILKTTININNKPLIIYVNHWRSKRAPESKRIYYATALINDIKQLKKEKDYIILGDLNSNYNEYQTFKYEKRLNDTYNLTGINHILNTTIKGNLVSKHQLFNTKELIHYNLWKEVDKKERFSSKFKSNYSTPDNIIIPKSLVDNKNISYVDNSFFVFKPKYLYKKYVKRWNKRNSSGYSDHLPIVASFSTTKQNYKYYESNYIPNNLSKIDYLYNIEKLNSSIDLENCLVIYKHDKIAIIKHPYKASKAIAVYKPNKTLKTSYSYNIRVNKIDNYNGLKEIKSLEVLNKKKRYKNYKSFYLDGNKIDLYDLKYQSNIIKNLSGVYKRKYLYYGDKKIKLYFKKGIKKPEENSKITISSGHLGIYKSKIQIVLHKQSDFSYN